jgi:hypothetical protein
MGRRRNNPASAAVSISMKPWIAAGLLMAGLDAAAASPPAASRHVVVETLEISPVSADFRVGFSLLTTPERQYAAYYDSQRRMTVAARALDATEWVYQVLPSTVEWDSHNYVTMAIDSAGHLHVSGNLHGDPLVYFRTTQAGNIATLAAAEMTGELENRMTYPRFFTDHEDRLIFTYRHGGSGNGINLYNRYDPGSRSWSRLLETPLFDGEGRRNAYPSGPSRGPDGWFHVHWVWRDTPDCATNQHLSYARSRDLVRWESAFGTAVDLPIRFGRHDLVVDPIPSGGGIINGGHRLAFDAADRPVLVYHKADSDGNMQLHAARPADGRWENKVLTRWKHPVPFSGGGSMDFIGIRIGEFRTIAPGVFGIHYRHKDYGAGLLQIGEHDLALVDDEIAVAPDLPRLLNRVESDFPGMQIQRAEDLGSCGTEGVRYLLQWETLGPNRDRPRDPPLPAPSRLRLHKLVPAAAAR